MMISPHLFAHLGEVRVCENPLLTVTETIHRSWRSRLFTRPWQPWVTTEMRKVPDRTVYQIAPGILVCHPSVAEELRRQIQESIRKARSPHQEDIRRPGALEDRG